LVGVTVEGNGFGFSLTSDRKRLVHRVDQALVCRRVEDFGVLWTRLIDREIDMKAKDPRWNDPDKAPYLASAAYDISADGNRVALAAQGGSPERHYIEILNGNDGSLVARWPLRERHGFALSQNGRLLALAELMEGKSSLEPTMHILDVPSAKEITTVI